MYDPSLLTRKNPDQFDTNNISVPQIRDQIREQFSPNNFVLLLDEFHGKLDARLFTHLFSYSSSQVDISNILSFLTIL